MATLMTWKSSGGDSSRCDAKCHNAVEAECVCMCGGLYHGAARNGTLDALVKEHGDSLLERLVKSGQIDPVQSRLL